MKKLLFITLIALGFISCKKSANTTPTASDTLKFTVTQMAANNTYNLTYSTQPDNAPSTVTNVLTLNNSTDLKMHSYLISHGTGININWLFTLNGQYKGTGVLKVQINSKVIYTSTATYGGSYYYNYL